MKSREILSSLNTGKLWVGLTFLVPLCVVVLGLSYNAQAMPNFARQYGMSCTGCHTIVPRLNRTGYEFRRAGFRNPSEIGETRDFEKDRDNSDYKVANYFAARLQMNSSYKQKDTGPGPNTHSTQIEFKEFTLYPLTGAFLKNWASEAEISGGTDEIEVENAYLRYTGGNDQTYWHLRGGIFHPFEGFGASDRPMGLSRPLIQTKGTKNANGDVNDWHPWGYDQSGFEGGVSFRNTYISAAVFNGLIENADDPAQGGKLKKATGSPTQNDVDFQVFVNQFIPVGKTEIALSGYYYNGRISLGPDTSLAQNDFQRYAVYLTIPIQTAQLLGAYSGGRDTYKMTDASIDNKGFFVELDNVFNDNVGAGARFDWFDPSDVTDNDITQAISAFVNVPLNNGVQFIAEYKYSKTERGTNPDEKDNSVNIRSIYIF